MVGENLGKGRQPNWIGWKVILYGTVIFRCMACLGVSLGSGIRYVYSRVGNRKIREAYHAVCESSANL